jgi:hypothetical protein
MRKIITKRLASFYIDVPGLRPGTVGAYTFAFVSAAVATALRVVLDPYVVGVQFITFAPAIVITTLISGFGAGFFCVVLSTAAADFFVLSSPRFSFYIDDPAVVAGCLPRWHLIARSSSAGCALQSSASGRRGPCGPAKTVCSRPLTQ